MELAKLNGPVTTIGGGKAMNFKIAENAKMFRILSDNMYQDKIGSIVREISCNALDSHIAAGNADMPFDIHLPDQFEPWFTVRDYGVGMSPDMVEQVFCSYGESTKDQSNDAIGAFGLGAKTPFAYTDQFNIVTIYNGVMYSYSAFYNSDGLPEIVLMAETPTTERNGVEIKLGVKPNDFRNFHDAVRNQLRFFPVKPDIANNVSGFHWHSEPKYLFESDSVRIYQASGYNNRAFIIQGPVGYPMDVNQVVNSLTPELAAFLRTLVDTGVHFVFNIGEIGVTASREGVEYNAHTLNSLKNRVAGAYKDIKDWIESQISSMSSVYEKVVFVNENQTFRSIINQINLDLSPAKKDSVGNYYFSLGSCPEFMVNVKHKDVTGKVVSRDVQGISIVEYTRAGMNGFSGSRNSTNDAQLRPRSDTKGETVIVLRDGGKTPVVRMRHYFKENNLHRMYALNATNEEMKLDKSLIAALIKHLGGFDNIKLVSELPDPPKTAYDRTRTDYSRPTAYLADSGAHDDLDSVANWTRVYDKLPDLQTDDGDAVEEAIYVTVERQRIESIDYDIKRLYSDLCRAGVVDIPLYGIRENDVSKLADTDTKWIRLADYVKAKRDEVLANPNIKRYSVANAIQSIVNDAIGPRLSGLQGLNPRTRIARLNRVAEKAGKIATDSKVNQHILRIAQYDAESHPAIAVVRNMAGKMFENIPMARYVQRGGYGPLDPNHDETKHLVEYINHFEVNA